ncbi:MAG: glycosyltransferase family 2 protein [Candidatus Aminicenantes bacterium]
MEAVVNPLLTVVMPVYNEEEVIEQVIRDIYSSVLSKIPDSELLAVDDGSSDSTPLLLDNLAQEYSQVIPLHKPNGGHGDAVLYGLERARGEYIFLTDSDGQTDPRDFWALWPKRHGAELVCGVRAKRYDPLHRLVIARLLRFGIRMIFGVHCQDANVPFKLMTRDLWQKAQKMIPRDTLTPSLFLSILAASSKQSFEEVDIRHLPRATGTSTIRYLKLLRFCIRAFSQLMGFRRSLAAPPEVLKGR